MVQKMFGIVNFSGFLISSVLLNITPGSDTIYILSKSATGGRKRGIASALGISTGILIHTLLAAVGLSIVLAKSAVLFNILKIAGATYLIVMGIKAIISKESIISGNENEKNNDILHVYKQGILTNVLNPKVALFFLALLPQFVDVGNTYGPLPFILLGCTFFVTSTIWTIIIACLSSLVTGILNRNEKISSISNKAAGMVYIGLGLNLLRAKVAN